ncbi:hypothetical protein N7516_000670 [Penicillium verrucosum]|uniref:uncharacterized protein n=1 Tax=Penicillium verrucosum TaxID=60171 RepID=UPI002544FF2D|nr:uncharacterized protein N7516_000670 [Penicillium verrucosum]KAJ5940502.1 hypothetical protein N7516_000670 [Penicillium verrucosum]
MAESTFAFNVAYTVPVNGEGMTPTLTYGEFWKGLRRGGRNPHDFADYVASTEVHADQTATEFKRSLTLADGAVHSTRGTVLHQDVRIAEGLHVEATTTDTGAKSTMLLSYGGAPGEGELTLFLTAMYELRVEGVIPGSPEANAIETNYAQLAKGAAITAVEKIRLWKVEDRLDAP